MCADRDKERIRYSKVPAFDSTSSGKAMSISTSSSTSTAKKLSFEELMKQADANASKKQEIREEVAPTQPMLNRRPLSPTKLPSTNRGIRKPVLRKKKVLSVKHPSGELIKLNQNKRDLRSIEQIQYELKREKQK